MIVNASSNRSMRWSNGMPNARNSVSFQPAPRPRMRRPPLISSIVSARLASIAGLWNAVQATSGPSSIRLVAAARAASIAQASHGPRGGRRSDRAGGRRPRPSRSRGPRWRGPCRGAPASGPLRGATRRHRKPIGPVNPRNPTDSRMRDSQAGFGGRRAPACDLGAETGLWIPVTSPMSPLKPHRACNPETRTSQSGSCA